MLPLPSSSSSRQKYDVFLSFRGEDTRKKFTDHLYAALKRNGIVTFKDDSRLEAGEEIAPELFKAIKESWCSVIVFSETYAFSSWCLDELAEIVEQRNKREHKIFPIFYDVDPSNLRKQTGKVDKAFSEHEEKYKEDKDKTERWRTALTEVANIKGWHLCDSHESHFIEEIVRDISTKLLYVRNSYILDGLVGIDSRLEELLPKIDIEEDGVRIVGICGMGGIGKTTLASVFCGKFSSYFDGRCFLSDVREVSQKFGLVSLQKQLLSQILLEEGFHFSMENEGKSIIRRRLSHKKVLVVIDDVDNIKHLECLVGRRDWFGSGSRIIVTTRDKQLLRSHGIHEDDVYEPTTLDADEALRLFNMKAFESVTVPQSDFIQLSKQVVKYADGLPLALEVFGSFLCGRDAALWRSEIERLERDSNEDILDRLRISFDGLKETEKNIFLDIACFFHNREEKDFVIKVLNGCEFSALIGTDVLINKSLIKDRDGYFWMHDLLREMGRKIVRQNLTNEPGKRSRLWEEKDVRQVLTNNTATEAIESMVISLYGNEMSTLSAEAFLNMKNLRMLKVFSLPGVHDLNYISNELRLLDWPGYPFKSLPSKFEPNNLVALLIPNSSVERPWKGMKRLDRLKLVNLKGSVNLVETPDFTMAPDLESLILEGCTRLEQLHHSIGALEKLEHLNLRGCKSLKSLPDSIEGCKCLKTLNLSGCIKVETLPENLQSVKSLEELDLSETAITYPPSFLFHFKSLVVLSFNGVKGPPSKFLPKLFSCIPFFQTDSMALILHPLSGLTSLRNLILGYCDLKEGAIPSDIGGLPFLERVNLSGNSFTSLPETFGELPKVNYIDLSDCTELKSLPEGLTKTRRLCVDGCTSLELIEHPSKIGRSGSAWFSGTDCYRMAENNDILAMVKNYLKVFANARPSFSMNLPGSEIPKWFSHQNDETSIRIPLPPNICNDSQWIGVAFCCIFCTTLSYEVIASESPHLECDCIMHVHGRKEQIVNEIGYFTGGQDTTLKQRYAPSAVKDHVWLIHWPRDQLYPLSSKDEIPNLECDEISARFYGSYYKVKKCGVRIVYKKDLEEMEEIIDQSNNLGDHNGIGGA